MGLTLQPTYIRVIIHLLSFTKYHGHPSMFYLEFVSSRQTHLVLSAIAAAMMRVSVGQVRSAKDVSPFRILVRVDHDHQWV